MEFGTLGNRRFKVWIAASDATVNCRGCNLVAPDVGAFYSGHALSASTAGLSATLVPGEKIEYDTNGCKVTGAKAYLVGARVPLAVTAPRGTAFMGYYRDGEPWPNAEEYRKTSLAYTMGKEDVALVAKFKKEVVTVVCDSLELGTFTAGVACGFGSGVLLDEGAGIATESGVKSIAVNKLPTGMKFNATTHLLTGWPTKAGAGRH